MIKKAIFALLFSASSLLQASPLEINTLADHETIKPGEEFAILLDVKLDQDFHAYWKNPGDVGMAPTIEWNLPQGVSVIRTEWPTPKRFETEDALTFGYEEKAPFLITFALDRAYSADSVDIHGTLQWVVCSKDTCLPGATEIHTKIATGPSSILIPGLKSQFQDVKKALPQKVAQEAFQKEGENFFMSLPDDEIAMNETPLFFPETGTESRSMTLHQTDKGARLLLSSESPLRGVIVLGEKAFEVDFKPAPKDLESLNLGTALLFALLGGLILNLMPCVLPVVSLKVMSFVKMAGESQKELMKHGLAFTFGVLVSFWALAALIIILQATGKAVGWGFQLQDPLFIGVLTLVFVLLALNLFGVFELGTKIATLAGEASYKSQKSGLKGSFVSGIFATAVATPCTGPFMGSALGYALAMPAYVSFLIFTALGLGMSLPYLLLGAFPKFIRWFPKPGAWMESFKQLLGFLMLMTAIWLLWVFAGQTSETALFGLLIALLIASFGAWIYGNFAPISKTRNTRIVAFTLTGLCLFASSALVYLTSRQIEIENKEIAMGGWESFSPERVAELREKKIPVLIDFTAKWCLICQVNHLALEDPAVSKILSEKGVVKMKADWTRYDPVITEALKTYGRSGVPLYVLYGEEEHPTILPQVLTKDNLMSSIEGVKLDKVALQ